MKNYGITMEGPLVLEKLATLPSWTSTDEGRIVYIEADNQTYIGSNAAWVVHGSDGGYGVPDVSFTDNDALNAGIVYIVDTTSASKTGILAGSPTAGQTVTIIDEKGTFKTHPFYINGNGKNINGESTLTLNVNNLITTLIYTGTEGWKADIGGMLSAINGGSASTGGVGNVNHVTSAYTAVDNDFLFCDTTTGNFVVTLPSVGLANGSAVTVYDQIGHFDTNRLTVNGGGNNIMGDSSIDIKTKYGRVDFIWDTDSTEWKTIVTTARHKDTVNLVEISAAYSADVNDFIMADTTAGDFSITLPTSGNLVDKSKISILDQRGTWNSYNLTVIPGDGTIDGDAFLVCDIAGLKVDLNWDKENGQWKVDFGGSILASTSSESNDMTWIVKTSNFNASANEKYLVDTGGGAVEVTLPSDPDDGQIVFIADGKKNFDNNNCTVKGNGNDINGITGDYIISTEGYKAEFVFLTDNWIDMS